MALWIDGEMTSIWARRVHEHIEFLENAGVQEFTIDLRKVTNVDSLGVDALLAPAFKGRSLKLYSATWDVERSLRIDRRGKHRELVDEVLQQNRRKRYGKSPKDERRGAMMVEIDLFAERR